MSFRHGGAVLRQGLPLSMPEDAMKDPDMRRIWPRTTEGKTGARAVFWGIEAGSGGG